jgi:hypothetical protein
MFLEGIQKKLWGHQAVNSHITKVVVFEKMKKLYWDPIRERKLDKEAHKMQPMSPTDPPHGFDGSIES